MIQFPARESKLQKPISLIKVKEAFTLTTKNEDFDKRDDIEIYLNETEINKLLCSKVGNKSSGIKGYDGKQIKDIYKKFFDKNAPTSMGKNEAIDIIIKEIYELMKHRNKNKQDDTIIDGTIQEGYGDRYPGYDDDD